MLKDQSYFGEVRIPSSAALVLITLAVALPSVVGRVPRSAEASVGTVRPCRPDTHLNGRYKLTFTEEDSLSYGVPPDRVGSWHFTVSGCRFTLSHQNQLVDAGLFRSDKPVPVTDLQFPWIKRGTPTLKIIRDRCPQVGSVARFAYAAGPHLLRITAYSDQAGRFCHLRGMLNTKPWTRSS